MNWGRISYFDFSKSYFDIQNRADYRILTFKILYRHLIWPQILCFDIQKICNLVMFWKSWFFFFWGVVCWENISYHVAAFVIPFNLIGNMAMFWRSWILSFWPHPLSPHRGSDPCLWSKITFDMFHNYCTSVCMQQLSKNVDNWLSYCKN